jgi:hypothetical protein
MGGLIKNLEDAVKGITLAALLGTSMFSSASETLAFAQQQKLQNKLQDSKKAQEQKRDEVPDDATQRFREDQIKKSFSEDYKKKDIASKIALSDKLAKIAEDPKNDPALKFSLTLEGMRAASEGLDLQKAYGLAERLSESYNTSDLRFKCEAFNISRKIVTNAEQATSVGVAGYDLAASIYVAGDIVSAIKIASDAKGLPKLPKDAVPKFTDLISEMTQVSNAEMALSANPNDAKSSNIVARYTALRRGKWANAKDIMMKGSDEDLKLIIDSELANPDNIESQYGLAMKYFDSAKNLKGFEKDQYVQRGLYWCNEAIPKANALMKADIEKKMKEFGGSATKSNLVDLLKMIDVKKDSVKGEWKLENGKLIAGAIDGSKIEIPYKPSEEYDFRIKFTPLGATPTMSLILVKGGNSFAYAMGASGNKWVGFDMIDGKSGSEHPSTVKKDNCLESGRTYTATIKVRRDQVSSYLDDKLIVNLKTDGKNLSIHPANALRDNSLLGFANFYQTSVTYHTIEVIEVSGSGKRIR